MSTKPVASVLLFGGGGFLGRALVANLRKRGATTVTPSHTEAPVETLDAVRRAIDQASPDTIVNLAAAQPHADEVALMATNARGAENVAQAASIVGAHLLHVSTDCVFDGLDPPYGADTPCRPCNAYGRSKAAGEAAVQAHAPDATIVRTSLIWDPHAIDRATQGFADRLARGEPLRLFTDEIRCPLDRTTLAEAIARLLERRHAGVVNVAGREALSRHTFGTLLLDHFDVPGRELAQPIRLAELPQSANGRRAPNLTLDIAPTEQLLDLQLRGPHAHLTS